MTLKDDTYYVQGVLDRDKRIIAKTITLIESSLAQHQKVARRVINHLLPHTGKAVRLGISGVPGAGKSTFIESLGTLLVAKSHRVAVLAVDPSSKRSGGSVLADKTRMEKLSVAENAFIRPSPSGGTLGGVARKTRETMLVCEAAGYDVMIVETVGVGQSEITVASMVDFFLLLMIAGAGDELQGIKKGVLEVADAIAVNKADGDNIDRAERAAKQYENALHYLIPTSTIWSPKVMTCSSLAAGNAGIIKIWETVLEHRRRHVESGALDRKRQDQALDWMWSLLEEGLKERFFGNPKIVSRLPQIKRSVKNGETAPTVAADELLFSLDNQEVL
ncbi:MAG: methylmalonyl Co-A mutase-associated GTPase MeaB [Deltaproteobacteria bacterium]|nr:methylmalonyl Co-A mutase-associated GTPase MeaB [Deltaproteobacteria bacterium]